MKTLDGFVNDILKNKKKQKDLDFDNVLEKNQGRNRSAKIWTAVESARLYQEDSVEVNLKEIQEFVEQTVLLLGQALNSISYYRRLYHDAVSTTKIKYIMNKIQTLSPRPSPDTEKEFRRATTTEARLFRKGTTSQYSKKRYNNGNENSYGCGYGK